MLSALTLADWACGTSFLHQRDARVKLAALVIVLVAITTTRSNPAALFLYGVLLIAGAAIAHLALGGVLVRAAAVIPFAAAAAAAIGLANGWPHAAALLARSYLCALAVVLIAGTTTAPELFSALRWFGAPRALVVTIQFLYRFLVLMGEQAMRLRYAALARRGPGRYRRSLKAVAAVSIAALFASAYSRAERVHRSMLSRGYTGELHAISAMKFASADWAFLLATIGLTLAIRAR